jgi:hypothetical protein
MNRADIINYLIAKRNYKSYLEIGVDNGKNYQQIVCENKYCVDPYFLNNSDDVKKEEDIPSFVTWRMTSDEMFDTIKKSVKFDIIFIDGLHTEEQVGKDIINSLKHLNVGGCIVVHDCLPPNENAQIVPRIQGLWCGDVWKAITMLKEQNIQFNVVDTDLGCGIISYCENAEELNYMEKSVLTWYDFLKHRNELLNVISEFEFFKKY